jgi:hypothetical protein
MGLDDSQTCSREFLRLSDLRFAQKKAKEEVLNETSRVLDYIIKESLTEVEQEFKA